MRKIGISLATLLAVALTACAESPTASAAGAEAALNGVYAGSGPYEEDAGTGTWEPQAMEGTSQLSELDRGPGLAGSGH